MRTTITLDDDVVALIESERQRTGESFRATVNRLLRRSARSGAARKAPSLPTYPGRPLVDLSDVSAVLAALDEERRAERGLP
jgi:negative regulator of replication initiation